VLRADQSMTLTDNDDDDDNNRLLRPNSGICTHIHRMSTMSNYLHTHAKYHRSSEWSAANSGMLSCIIAKNSALMLSACTQ